MHPWKRFPVRIIEARLLSRISCTRANLNGSGSCGSSDALCKHNLLFQPFCRLNKSFSSHSGFFSISHGHPLRSRKRRSILQEVMSCWGKIRQHVSVVFVRVVASMLLVTSVSIAVSNTPACKFYFM